MRLNSARVSPLIGLLVVFIAGGFAVHSMREHTRRAPVLTAQVERAKGAADAAASTHAATVAVTDAAIDTLRKTVTLYDTLRRQLALGDTAKLLGQIPKFVLASDALRDRATALETTLLGERAAATSLDATRVAVIHAQDELIEALRYVPPIESHADVRYDPIGKVYGAGAQVRYRVVRDWSVGVGAKKWLGGDGRGYVVVSHPIL